MTSKQSSSQLFSPQVRQVLTNLSSKIFWQEPSYSHMDDDLPGNEIVTNLPLQMSMYYNVFFFPFWLTSEAIMLNIKYQYLDDTYKVLLIAILLIFSAIEIIRLYLGYVGNLHEKVPEIAGFLLFTILPQLPLLLLLLLNDSMIIMPVDRAVNIILLVLYLFQMVSGYFTVKAMVRQQTTKLHLQQFVDLEQIPAQGDNYDVYANPNVSPVRRNTIRA
uniref:Transmembrane protein 17B-like n=1 Tax=Phallusia mammillata TaxID=59560 RepID=A0A6F9DVQ2_9ASCI|nr:transmembrane protein 17B-like [Phallusia mammillata]